MCAPTKAARIAPQPSPKTKNPSPDTSGAHILTHVEWTTNRKNWSSVPSLMMSQIYVPRFMMSQNSQILSGTTPMTMDSYKLRKKQKKRMWSCYIKEKFESKEVSYIDQKSSVECLLIKIKGIIAKGQLLLGKDENLVCVRPTAPGPHK